ncbi:hypothetical protein J7T55_009450 [Diaporthe amygdali]|uniref:uncharacterized protein n=1 Tax=Phomopsis amygdali TaxID=1214568 RepID=UPI0022FDBE61|nr:uncharacterized protein J7T55_009450 [Diaporthe amygdali]KAJ0104286.1 hypothetical protein J7T55_009450 [Diaporthe amygdali]
MKKQRGDLQPSWPPQPQQAMPMQTQQQSPFANTPAWGYSTQHGYGQPDMNRRNDSMDYRAYAAAQPHAQAAQAQAQAQAQHHQQQQQQHHPSAIQPPIPVSQHAAQQQQHVPQHVQHPQHVQQHPQQQQQQQHAQHLAQQSQQGSPAQQHVQQQHVQPQHVQPQHVQHAPQSTSVQPQQVHQQPPQQSTPQPAPAPAPAPRGRKRAAPPAAAATPTAPVSAPPQPVQTPVQQAPQIATPVPVPTPPAPIAAPTQPATPVDNAQPAAQAPPAKKSRTNTPWTPAEELRLKQMRDNGSSWAEIAKTFPARTEGSVKKHWYKDMHYAEFAEDEVRITSAPMAAFANVVSLLTVDSLQSAALMSAIKEYENNKWKVIGQKVGKPAKACEQYAKEHFPAVAKNCEQAEEQSSAVSAYPNPIANPPLPPPRPVEPPPPLPAFSSPYSQRPVSTTHRGSSPIPLPPNLDNQH